MKRFSAISLFIALTFLVGTAPAAHAQPVSSGAQYAGSVENIGATAVENALQTGPGIGVLAPDPAAENTPLSVPPNPDLGDGFGRVMTWIMTLFAWLVGVAAIVLDYTVYFTVVTMGDYVKDLSAVGVTWRIMRDIGNIIIIFGFLAIGISIILNTERLGYGKKMLPMLLVSAVFLNFSLFIAEAVIDTGNLFATQFYTQIKGGVVPSRASLSQTTIENEGISNKIMGQLGLQTIYTAGRVNTKVFEAGNTWVVGFMAVILFLVTAFVMFSLAFILIARFVILLFLIIIAPIGFAGLAVPKLASAAGRWWNELFTQTLTAPVLLLLLYVALAVITDASFLTGICTGSGGDAGCTKDWTGFVKGNNLAGFASMMLSFLIAMGLLLAVVILSKKMSAFGGGWATRWAGKLSGVSIAAGMPGWVGRNTAGAAGNYAAKWLRKRDFGRSFVGRSIADTLEKRVAGASFDIRNTDLGRSASKTGLDLGKGQTGGYKADLKARVESYERAAFAIEGRERTKEEKAAMNQAEANLKTARAQKETMQNERDATIAQNAKLKAESDRLTALDKSNRDKGVFDPKTTNDLKVAQQNLTTNATALAAAEAKLTEAEKNRASRVDELAKLEKKIQYATSKKGAQEKYAERLSAWGRVVPLFGTAATDAAKRIKSNAGKTKKQVDIETALSVIQANAGAATPPASATTTPPAPPTTAPPGGEARTS